MTKRRIILEVDDKVDISIAQDEEMLLLLKENLQSGLYINFDIVITDIKVEDVDNAGR